MSQLPGVSESVFFRRCGVWLIASACLLVAGCNPRHRKDDRVILANISGMPIYLDEFKRELARSKLETDDQGAPPADSEDAQKHAVLDDLIDRKLLLQEVERRNVAVPIDDIDTAYNRLRAGWKDDEFAAQLKEKDMTPAELKSELRNVLAIRKLFRDNFFSRVAVTDQEIETYVRAHPDELVQPEQVHAKQIVVKTVEQARKIANEIHQGLPFEDAAMKYSQSPDAKGGGDLGYFIRGVMPGVFDDTCFGLTPGEVSKPVSSSYGFHLFKVVEKLPSRTLTLADVRDRIELILRHDKERDSQAAKVKELRAAATIVIKEDRLAQL